MLIRRDYAVAEPQRLLAQAQRLADLDEGPGANGSTTPVVGTSVHAALGMLFGEYEPDEIASRHKEFGLEEGDSTLWVSAAEALPEPGSGSPPPSRTPTPSWWSAASTSAPSSTRRSWTRSWTSRRPAAHDRAAGPGAVPGPARVC